MTVIRGRNMDSIQWETLRKRVDEVIMELADQLSDAYYNYWRNGQSQPFYLWDVRPNQAANKLQFDLLHGAIFHIHTILLYKINQLGGDYDEQAMFATYNQDGTVADPIGKVTQARQWLIDIGQQYNVNWAPIRQKIVAWVKAQLNKDVVID